MAVDFTVVIRVRQRFGDNKSNPAGLETNAPLVGLEMDFPFVCPNIDRSQDGFLLFQSQGVRIPEPLLINAQIIPGGIPTSVETVTDYGASPTDPLSIVVFAQWKGNVMIIEPGVLDVNNVLHIQAGTLPNGTIDNFIIDNLVVVFKTNHTRPPIVDTEMR